MIISFISFKGGVGKSTLAQSVAVAIAASGASVALLDTDPTQATFSWSNVREETDVQIFVHENSGTVTKAVRKLATQFDFVVVDCPPAINPITTRILLTADINLIPILPSGSDTWTTERFLQHIDKVKAKTKMAINARFVINRFTPRVKLHQEFKNILQKYSDLYHIPISKSIINNRAVFQYANSDGCGVTQYDDPKAISEIEELVSEILN